jgi:hypothetical protein
MNKFRFTINGIAIAIFTLAFVSIAQGQATRTWVSGVGDDANPCSRTAPCKTFAGAYSRTAGGGEIDALDPGGFGTLTIGKSITIDGGGGFVASVLGSSAPGFTVNAATTDTIELTNLRINGINQTSFPGTIGIRIVAARGVHVLNCQIENWGTAGISDERSAGGYLEIDNTTVMNTIGNGISVNPASGSTSIHVHVANSRVQRSTSNGILLGSNVQASIFNSVFTQNVSAGVFAQQTAGGATDVNVDQCVVSNNVNGFQANTAGATIRVSNSTAIGNSILGAVAGGGVVSSYGNNQTAGLTFPSSGTGQQ